MTDQTPPTGLTIQQTDALWDAVAIPGPDIPTFTVQHERVCRAVAGILAEMPPAAPTADRVDVLREVADICDEAGGVYASKALNDHADAAFRLMERFQRKANEAEYVATPCDPMVACEDGGEPCHIHERLMAHAEGDHELCAPDCGTATAVPVSSVVSGQTLRDRCSDPIECSHEAALGEARETNRRLNLRAQRLKSKLAAYRRAVRQWEVSERGTYISHASLRTIGLVSGKDILGSVRHLKHFERVEQAEAAIERARALHQPDANGECQHCHYSSPCPTVQALERADAVLAVLPADGHTTNRAAVLREAADDLAEFVALHGPTSRTVAGWRGAIGFLRRLSAGAQQPAAGAQQPDTETRPARGDQFEAWLKAQRDEYEVRSSPQWGALDEVLDTYRLHADTGTPLDQHACEGQHCDCPPTAVPSAVPGRSTATNTSEETSRVVAYRSPLPGALSLYCTRHAHELGAYLPLTSGDLPDGGVCAKCHVDVLIPRNGATS